MPLSPVAKQRGELGPCGCPMVLEREFAFVGGANEAYHTAGLHHMYRIRCACAFSTRICEVKDM